MQGLYEFKGSDIRFLSLADKIWASNPFLLTTEMIQCNMRMSYRITNQIKSFVNHTMLGENRMDSCRDGELVKYIRNSRSNLEKTVIYEIKHLLAQGVKPSDIFVLGASVKGANSNIRRMENALVSEGIPCFVPMLEMADKIDDRVIDGKVVFSTFHCVKGRQRAHVFIVGFDNGYLDYYARNLPKDRCPNTLYVAATRATNNLYLLEIDRARKTPGP
jgi:superfamily I DNA/RNA helicase